VRLHADLDTTAVGMRVLVVRTGEQMETEGFPLLAVGKSEGPYAIFTVGGGDGLERPDQGEAAEPTLGLAHVGELGVVGDGEGGLAPAVVAGNEVRLGQVAELLQLGAEMPTEGDVKLFLFLETLEFSLERNAGHDYCPFW